MKQSIKLTPKPWFIEQIPSPVYGSNGTLIAEGIGIGTSNQHITTVYTGGIRATESNRANAAHIVRCVNEREELLTLLGQFVHKVAMWPEGANPEYLPMMKKARALLARAEQEG